jgi:xanthine/uracil permease
MKVFTYIVIAIGILLIGLNITQIDFNKPFEGNSTVALIGIVATLCAVFLVVILKMAKMVEEKTKNQ